MLIRLGAASPTAEGGPTIRRRKSRRIHSGRPQQHTSEWVRRGENLVVCGPSGNGKTVVLEVLGQLAVEAGMKGRLVPFEDFGALGSLALRT